MIDLVLFDFDGTLADTAPGLVVAANKQRIACGLEPLPYSQLRAVASHGARGLLGAALGLTPDDPGYPAVRDQFLADYESCMYDESALFDGIPELLQTLEQHGLAWGIVTNKSEALAHPLIQHFGIRPSVVVCGDTTPYLKPHPLPLLRAAEQIDINPTACIYVGDDLRDIQAGHAAEMLTMVASWGYCGDAPPISEWNAHHIADNPAHTWNILTNLKSEG